MSGHEARLLARAAERDETSELAGQVTGILGGARAAGLDPDALRGLTGAAIALGGNHVAIVTASAGPRFPSEREFASAVVDAEDEIISRLRAAQRLRAETVAALAAARAALTAAHAMPAETDKQRAARDAAIAAAQTRIALCEEALGILGPLAARLRHALNRIRAVPSDVGETYESVYRLLRRGGEMPFDGDWITGEGTERAAVGE
jgi:hypothetical protein